MKTPENHATACAVEGLVNAHRQAGLDDIDLALALMACGSALLVPLWGAERTLGAFDALVLDAATPPDAGTPH